MYIGGLGFSWDNISFGISKHTQRSIDYAANIVSFWARCLCCLSQDGSTSFDAMPWMIYFGIMFNVKIQL